MTSCTHNSGSREGAVVADPAEYATIASALLAASQLYIDLARSLRAQVHPGDFRVLRIGEPGEAQVALLCLDPGNPRVLMRCGSASAAPCLLEALPRAQSFELWTFDSWPADLVSDVLGGEFLERRWYHVLSSATFRPFNAGIARKLTEHDSSLIDAFPDEYARRLFDTEIGLDDGCRMFGVEREGELLSFAAASPAEHAIIPEVVWVSTRAAHRRRGYGKAAVSQAVAETLAAGATIVHYSGVAESNVASLRLCRSLGFEPVGCATVFRCAARDA